MTEPKYPEDSKGWKTLYKERNEPSKACAFVVIMVEIGSEQKMMGELKAIPEVKEAHIVHGAYDIIARVESDTRSNVRDVINWKIRRLVKVRSVMTMIVTDMIVKR